MLQDHAGDVLPHARRHRAAPRRREGLRLVAGAPTVGAQGLDHARVHRVGDQDAGARTGARQVHGLHERGGAVIQGGVRDLERGELAHERLELEQRLQHPLRQLRLVGRVGGLELRAPRQGPHDARDVVVVGAGTREAHELLDVAVARREAGQILEDLGLGDPIAQAERPVQTHRCGDRGEQVVDRSRPDAPEHRADVLVGVGGEAHRRSVYGPPS